MTADQQVWECPFNRDDLLRIWGQDEESLTMEDEKRAFKLLTTYSGTCPVQFLSCIRSRIQDAAEVRSHSVTRDTNVQRTIVSSSNKLAAPVRIVCTLLTRAYPTAPTVAGKVFKWGRV